MDDYLRSRLDHLLSNRQDKKDLKFAVPVRFVEVRDPNCWELIADDCGIDMLSDDEYREKFYGGAS